MGVAINAIMEAKVIYNANGQELQNVLHYAPNVTGVGTEIDITDGFLTVFNSNAVGTLIETMQQCMSQEVEIYELTAQLVHPTRFIVRSVDVSYFGAVNSPCDAQNVAAVFTKRGSQANKHNVGSFHLGGLPLNLLQHGLLSQVLYEVKLNNLRDAIALPVDDPVSGITWSAAILNRTKTLVGTKYKYPITGRSIIFEMKDQPQVRTMRRRTVGLGI